MAKRPERPTSLTEPRTRAKFLDALAEGLSVTAAAERANVSRQTAYENRSNDAELLKAWDEAIERGTDRLEDKARERAADGTLKPVFQGGKKVGSVREFSDQLMMFLLKGRRGEKFRDNSKIELSGKLTLEQLIAESQKPKEPTS